MKPVGERSAGDPHAAFDERGKETEQGCGLRHRHLAKAAGNSNSPHPPPPRPSSTLPSCWGADGGYGITSTIGKHRLRPYGAEAVAAWPGRTATVASRSIPEAEPLVAVLGDEEGIAASVRSVGDRVGEYVSSLGDHGAVPWTTRPPVTVSVDVTLAIRFSSQVRMSSDNSAQSAYLPGSMVPFTSSSKLR